MDCRKKAKIIARVKYDIDVGIIRQGIQNNYDECVKVSNKKKKKQINIQHTITDGYCKHRYGNLNLESKENTETKKLKTLYRNEEIVNGFTNKLEMAEERISELKNTATEISKTEMEIEGEKNEKKKKKSPRTLRTISKDVPYKYLENQKEKKKHTKQKKYVKYNG